MSRLRKHTKKEEINRMEVTICIGSSCHLKGSREVIAILQRLIALNRLENRIELKGSFCMGECMNNGVCVCIDGERFSVTPLGTEEFFKTEIMKRLGK